MKVTKNIVWVFIGICLACIIGMFLSSPIVIEKHYDMALPSYFSSDSNKYIMSNQLEEYKDDIRTEYQSHQDAQDKKLNFLLAILAVAMTTWVSLNIVNYFDKQDLSKLIDQNKDLVQETHRINAIVEFNTKSNSMLTDRIIEIYKLLPEIRNDQSEQKIALEKLEAGLNDLASVCGDEVYQKYNQKRNHRTYGDLKEALYGEQNKVQVNNEEPD